MTDSAHNSDPRRPGRRAGFMCPTHQAFIIPNPSNTTTVECSTGTNLCENRQSDRVVNDTASFSQNFPVTHTSSTVSSILDITVSNLLCPWDSQSVQTSVKTDVMSQTEESQRPTQRTVIIQRCQSAQVQLDEPSPTSAPTISPVDEVRNFVQSQVRAFLDQLPAKRLEYWDQTKAGQCSVCFEDYRSGHVVMTLPCFHMLHEDCARRWFEGVS
ncbi:hypothetical protein FBUS_02257 [Fasciolopsis buskii]|uniref:RING-type domain-containing protein n=1 Tax=Fasciolopsis buskii TaxID=27845 RepID=A0A8E0S120_9TREM|nr:hypothetical protein FBUS_02257 [Fasciolopsis buski]